MITGSLKNKINAIWQDFYNENMAQVSDIVNQLTTLMFIKMLDDKQSAMEAQASIIGIKPREDDLTFKSGNYVNDEYQINVPYDCLRWKNFKNLNPNEMARVIKNYVIPFIKDPKNKAVGKFGLYAKKYTFGFDDKERLLTNVVDKLSDPELDFTNVDLMGDVYEYMCGSGISGQYRTPRHIIDMAVEMMKPKLGEKIIDPAMGTAGFLIESAKYIKEHQSKDLLNINNQNLFSNDMFYGCDNDSNMARIGYMNCVLHGVKNPSITMDSLLENENAKEYLGEFDLVLANPPFSGSLVEDATNGKILSITKTKKTELLFVALMSMLLKLGGRCMTIVPDGVLFGSDTAHKNLRIELIEKQKLIGVVSMPNGIFSAPSKKGSASKGAGVKTSFLIFQRTDNGGTDYVWFYNMTNDGYTLDAKRSPVEGSDIPDIIERFNHLEDEFSRSRKDKSFMVPVSEIKENDYDLTINKYREVEKETKVYRPTSEILTDIENLEKEINECLVSLKSMIGDKE
ncbi:MAG: N-6 DNA methylase [Firmicutes bacterium]|nr:N-6 DNA methylase [Bacillota bacterium]